MVAFFVTSCQVAFILSICINKEGHIGWQLRFFFRMSELLNILGNTILGKMKNLKTVKQAV